MYNFIIYIYEIFNLYKKYLIYVKLYFIDLVINQIKEFYYSWY